MKKPKLVSKRDQLTSTSDLTGSGKKHRQLSGVSTVTAATTCSQCSSSAPTYVENLREQSDTLRHEIGDLKNEIEQLQTSQQELFQQLRTYFQSKPDRTITTLSQNSGRNDLPFLLLFLWFTYLVPPTISSVRSPTVNETFGNLPVPLPTRQKSRSISTESLASSSTTTSEPTTSSNQTITEPVAPVSYDFKSLLSKISGDGFVLSSNLEARENCPQ